MATKLTQTHRNQLSKWIDPTKRHKFILLYKISRDGCNANTFHNYCNNKGPTVTVLYNTDKSVYGGYTAENWTSNITYVDDAHAFLFKLEYNGKENPMKFPTKNNGTNAMYNKESCGPTFGNGHDLHCFDGNVDKSGNYFPLNGKVNLGNTYDMLGQDYNTVMNGHQNVLELKVYSVQEKTLEEQRQEDLLLESNRVMERPWIPNIDWSSKHEEMLKEKVATYKPLAGLNLKQANILLVGQVGAGKSSFFNTINSIYRGHISVQANAGSAEHSLTTSFRLYQVRDGPGGKPLNFRLCDTRGLEEDQGLTDQEIGFLLDGHVPEKYKFNSAVPLSPDSIGFVKNPTLSNKIHCVAFVLDSSTVDVMSEKVIEQIKAMQTSMNQRLVPQAVLLTNIDRICQKTSEDISKVFFSSAVKECVERVSMMMGLPQSQVLPVKNYHREADLDQNINILSLRSLRRILNFVDDSLHNRLDEIEAEKPSIVRMAE
ncbi:interferon-induced protein 44-like [Ylistrum balloti]|uniref:interferon-induced protein 44-like n=1 Tax=Ylistrum balloti TaxID=509963 RepID=UPI002905A0CB|nr:interferon-induced protein 44-like [Ylistrum balloti]